MSRALANNSSMLGVKENTRVRIAGDWALGPKKGEGLTMADISEVPGGVGLNGSIY